MQKQLWPTASNFIEKTPPQDDFFGENFRMITCRFSPWENTGRQIPAFSDVLRSETLEAVSNLWINSSANIIESVALS